MRYEIEGREVTAEEYYDHHGTPEWLRKPFQTAHTYRDHDPLLSEGLGCMKSQVGEMREVIRKHNIKGVTVRDSGQLEITSRRGRRELLKVRGLCDNDGCYSD